MPACQHSIAHKTHALKDMYNVYFLKIINSLLILELYGVLRFLIYKIDYTCKNNYIITTNDIMNFSTAQSMEKKL